MRLFQLSGKALSRLVSNRKCALIIALVFSFTFLVFLQKQPVSAFIGGYTSSFNSAAVVAQQSSPLRRRGDVNGDGSITVQDLISIIQHLSGAVTLTGDDFKGADLTGDNQVKIDDLIRLIQTITGVKPAPPGVAETQLGSGAPGSSVTATITGTDLGSVDQVIFNPLNSADAGKVTASVINASKNGSRLNIRITIAPDAAPGARTFSVRNSAGDIISGGNASFTVIQPAPTITGIAPASGSRGSTVSAFIVGANLQGATQISFAGEGVTAVINSANSTSTNLSLSITVSATAQPGARTFELTTPAGKASSGAVVFVVEQPPTSITGIVPSSGSQGQTVNAIITGANLSGAVSVEFSGTGISAQIQPGATDTTLPVRITIGQDAPTDARTFIVTTDQGLFRSGTATFQVLGREGRALQITTSNPVVNENQTLKIEARVVDSAGVPIGGATLRFSSGSPDIASVDNQGNVVGIEEGFATITVTDPERGLSRSLTVAVTRVDQVNNSVIAGAGPGEIRMDPSGQLFATDLTQNIVRRTILGEPWEKYAGTGSAGAFDGPRLNAQFNGPLGVDIDRRDGSVYIADTANNIIRKITPAGEVLTVAGASGQTGSQDGTLAQARFRSPRGVSADFAGNLFISDGENHTIRYVDFQTNQVRTVAGIAGSPGNADKPPAPQAQFRQPQGLTFDPRTGGVIVVDKGNNLVRLVTPNGSVLSLGAIIPGSNEPGEQKRNQAGEQTVTFNAPVAASIDDAGNIYVAEQGGAVKVILRQTGQVINLAGDGAFISPTGIFVAGNEVLVYDASALAASASGSEAAGGQALKRLAVPPPEITAVNVTPRNDGAQLIVEGRNFASDTTGLVDGREVSLVVESTTRLRIFTPQSSGTHTLTVRHRGGAAQTTFSIVPLLSIAITSPANNAVVSDTVNVTVSVSSNVVGVQYRVDGGNFGSEVTQPPFSLSLNTALLTNGTHTLTAVARDSSGNTRTSAPVTINVQNITISITSPANNAIVRDTIPLTVSVSSNVVGVQYQVDGANVGSELTRAPFSSTLDTTRLSNGAHTLTAIARTASGATKTSAAVIINVQNIIISITAPRDNETVSGIINLTVSVSSNVVGVQYQVDGANVGSELTRAPFSSTLDTTRLSNGAHTLTAVARDGSGNTRTSSPVTINVQNVALDIQITSPAQGAKLSGTVNVTVTVQGNIVGVQYIIDGKNFGAEITAAPFTLALDTTVLADGDHRIEATARDSAGRTKTSPAVAFSVDNGPVTLTVVNKQGARGSVVTLQIRMTGSANDVSAIQFTFKMDPAVLSVSSAQAQSSPRGEAVPANFIYAVSPSNASGEVTVLISAPLVFPTPTIPGNGVVANIIASVSANAAAGITPLALSNVSVSDSTGTSVPVVVANGTFTVTSAIAPSSAVGSAIEHETLSSSSRHESEPSIQPDTLANLAERGAERLRFIAKKRL